jgi:hypothetical protein
VLRGSQAGLSYERIAGVIEGKGKEKQPTRSGIADGENMVMAGLWSKWKNPANGEEVLSCSVLAKQLLSDPDLALVRPGGYLRPPGRFAFYVGCTALWTRLLTRTGPTGAVAMTTTRGNAEVAPGGRQDRF